MNWLFLRGLSREQRHWGDFPGHFERRVGGRVHFLDLPGAGTEHLRESPTSIDGIAEDLRARFSRLRAAHDGAWGLLGVSLGGMVAMAWCATHPLDFARLVLASSSAGDLNTPLQRFSPGLLPDLLRSLVARDPVRREELILAMTTRMVRDPRRVAMEWARYQQESPVSRANVVRQLLAARAFRVPELEVPAFVVAGARDAMVHPSCSLRLAARLQVPFEIHPGAGHDLALDDPEWLSDRVATWLNAAQAETVQQILPSQAVRLRKQQVRIARPAGGALIATRKQPPGKPLATLVLVHGFAQNRYAFHLPGHSFSGWLAHAGIDTWNVELQGVGRSRDESPEPHTLDELVDDSFAPAVRFIAGEVGRPVFVLGHSLGGVLTFASVPAVRDQVAGAIIMAAGYRYTRLPAWERWIGRGLAGAVRTIGGPSSAPTHHAARFASFAPALLDNALMGAVPINAFQPGTVDRRALRWWLRNAFEPGFLGPTLQLLASVERGVLTSHDQSVDYGHRWETMPPLPVLGIAADRDLFVPPAVARESIEHTPGTDATFELFTPEHGGSHWGHADLIHGRSAPEFVWTRIRDWILRRA